MRDYWEGRFKAEGRIWGDEPSVTAAFAEATFRKHGVKTVLVPGSGYGRHTSFFAKHGYSVTGIELSKEALALASRCQAATHHHASVLDFHYETEAFDAVYCFNVLHLFRACSRASFLDGIFSTLKDGGIAFFVVFSEEEAQYGKGAEMEPGTFESKPGRPIHFFTERELRDTFRAFEIVDTGLLDDPENHGDKGRHTHRLRWIAARKHAVPSGESKQTKVNIILHITRRDAWAASVSSGYYRASSVESDGFIHCSTIGQATDTANGFFRGQRDLVLLCIDVSKLEASLRYEAPAGGTIHDPRIGTLFPHLYGPLNLSAVIKVVDFSPDSDGCFVLPREVQQISVE